MKFYNFITVRNMQHRYFSLKWTDNYVEVPKIDENLTIVFCSAYEMNHDKKFVTIRDVLSD